MTEGSTESARTNYQRLTWLLMEEGTARIRDAVCTHLYPGQPTVQIALGINKLRFEKLRRQSYLLETQYRLLYPENHEADVTTFDMTIWFILARNITPECKQIKWSKDPLWDEVKWQHDIIRVREIRNRLFHQSSAELSSSTFDILKFELVHALNRLGSKPEVIQEYFSRDLDPAETDRNVAKLHREVFEEMFQVSVAATRGRRHIIMLAVVISLLCLSVAVGIPLMVKYLSPPRQCSSFIHKIYSNSGSIDFITRKDWGAVPPEDLPTDPIIHLNLPVQKAVIYAEEFVQIDCSVTGDCCSELRHIQMGHKQRQWNDIAYNYLLDYNGVVYEGRGSHIQGRAAWGRNPEIISIAMIGNYVCMSASRQALMSLYVFLEYLTHSNPVTQEADPALTPDYALYGHCQVNLVAPEHNKSFPDSPGAATLQEIMYWDQWRPDNLTNCNVMKDCIKSSLCCKQMCNLTLN